MNELTISDLKITISKSCLDAYFQDICSIWYQVILRGHVFDLPISKDAIMRSLGRLNV